MKKILISALSALMMLTFTEISQACSIRYRSFTDENGQRFVEHVRVGRCPSAASPDRSTIYDPQSSKDYESGQ